MATEKRLIELLRNATQFHEKEKEQWILNGKVGERPSIMQSFARLLVENDVTFERHGFWVHDINNLYGCSECMKRDTMSPKKLKNYCPNCGAKMDGDGNV